MTLDEILKILENEKNSSKKLSAYFQATFSSNAKEEAAYHSGKAEALDYVIRLFNHYYNNSNNK